jgi:hypothetical protein
MGKWKMYGANPDTYPVGTGGSYAWSKAAGGVKLTTHLHLMPRLKMFSSITPYPHASSWRGA